MIAKATYEFHPGKPLTGYFIHEVTATYPLLSGWMCRPTNPQILKGTEDVPLEKRKYARCWFDTRIGNEARRMKTKGNVSLWRPRINHFKLSDLVVIGLKLNTQASSEASTLAV